MRSSSKGRKKALCGVCSVPLSQREKEDGQDEDGDTVLICALKRGCPQCAASALNKVIDDAKYVNRHNFYGETAFSVSVRAMNRYTKASLTPPSVAFALLCVGASEHVSLQPPVLTRERVAEHVDRYVLLHAAIDEYHDTLKQLLNMQVVVDTRVGLGENGIYHEPLERVLEYLGLPMDARSQPGHPTIDRGRKVSLRKKQRFVTALRMFRLLRALLP
jgi:hypothetical protein